MILNISEAANLGIHALTYLAKHHTEKRPISTVEVSKSLGVSSNHLSKVFQRLTKAGLLKSIRGPRGGFVLSYDPSEIKLLEIYEAIDGNLPPHGECLLNEPSCGLNNCIFGNLIEDVHEQVTKHFSDTTLAQIIS